MPSRYCDGFRNHGFIGLILFICSFFLLESSALAVPTVSIVDPVNGSRLDAGVSVFFSSDVQLSDPADTVTEYLWHSSLQGVLSTEASFNTVSLDVGLHSITLQVTDSNSDSDTETVQIEVVNDPPTVAIVTPAPDAVYGFGELITFRGTADDPQEGRLSGTSMVWTSSQGDDIGTGEAITLDNLTSGEHVITLTATDSLGISDFASVRIWIGNSPPRAEITAPNDGDQFAFREPITFRGAGEDDEDGALPASSLQWSLPATDTTLGQGTALAVDDLESGTHTIRLTVEDSEGATATDEIVVIVGNATPVATIFEPADNSAFAFGESITFTGSGTDSEDGDLTEGSLEWRSNVSGFLGSGATFSSDALAVGQHEITLIATDSESLEGTDTIRVVVGDEPPSSVSIDSPSDGASFFLNEFISFQGTARDNEDGALTGESLVWTSNIEEEPLGTGGSLSTNSLSEGEHRITLTATDSSGLSISDFIIIIVGNRLPEVEITAPENNSIFAFGELVTFQGMGNDEDDGRLTGASLVWTTSRSADAIGTGEAVSTSTLASGLHTITLTATDSSGAAVADSITITIENSSPTAQIILPEDGTIFANGSAILLSGSAEDAEDGVLTGLSLVWTLAGSSDILGNGTTLSVDLTSGNQIITLTATDSQGVSATDTVSIIVGKPGTIAIVSPLDNASFKLKQPIEFIGEAFDNEDGELHGESLVWTSNLVTSPLGTGRRLSIDSLGIGSHLITLTATDSDGNVQRAFMTISVEGTVVPTVSISAPAEGDSFFLNEYIEFRGSATDDEDGDISGAGLVWTSNRVASPIGTGSRISINYLPLGDHVITLTATDSGGNVQRTFITITIKEAQDLQVTILSPKDGSSFDLNEYIEFRGSATNDQGMALTRESLVWTSNLEKASLGTGEIFQINTLSMGEHLITLTATDSDNVAGTDFIVITIENKLPVPVITSPGDGEQFDDGESIIFAGSALDDEDGNLTGSALSWTSDVDGYIGSGVGFSNSLSQGEHVITLTARDSNAQEEKVTVSLTINPTEQSQVMTLGDQYLSVPLGQLGIITITGGHPPYRYQRDYPHIASMELNGREIRVIPESMGETTFQIIDHHNTTRTLYLTVSDTVENMPFADAGEDHTVIEGSTVTLDGTASLPGSHGILLWQWTQLGNHGKSVVLSSATAPKAEFVAPPADENPSLIFALTVKDSNGTVSSDNVTVNVLTNGVEGYPQGVTTFITADSRNSLGARIVGQGDYVVINPLFPEFIRDNAGKPENMVYGLVDLNIKVNPGGAAHMILYFPTPLQEDYEVYKYSEARGWYTYAGNVTFSSDRTKVYVTLQDGGAGDDDGVADGIISDPITFGTTPLIPPDPDDPPPVDDGGGGGGGGCFISTLLN